MGQKPLRFPLLLELGLSPNEALLYELLLENGPTKPSDLVEPSGLGRGNVYNILQQLSEKELVTLQEKDRLQTYEAVDPSSLRALLTQKQAQTHRLETAFLSTLPDLVSRFTLSTGKPAIQIFEGLAGIEQVLEDSLTATGEILTIADPEAISGDVLQLENRYIQKRISKKISKRVLMPSTPLGREWMKEPDRSFTQTRLCESLKGGFCAAIEIYDTRISLITLREDKYISVLIRDPSLAALQRAQFEALWHTSINNPLTPPPASPAL